MNITKYRPPNTQQESAVRYYLSGFSCIPSGMICWLIPDENGEALLVSYTESVIWLHDILVEFLDPPPQNANADCLTIKRFGKKLASRLLGDQLYDQYPVSK